MSTILVLTWNSSAINVTPTFRKNFWELCINKINLANPLLIIFSFQNNSLNFTPEMARLGFYLIGMVSHENNELWTYSTSPNFFVMKHHLIYLNNLFMEVRSPIGKIGISAICSKGKNRAMQEFVYDQPMDYVVVVGSFPDHKTKCSFDKAINDIDSCLTDKPPTHLEEGVDDRGLDFAPTCYLIKGRVPEESIMRSSNFKLSSPVREKDFQKNKIGWCDRIYYGTYNKYSKYKLVCLEYNRFDDLNISDSDHVIVYAVLEFFPVNPLTTFEETQ